MIRVFDEIENQLPGAFEVGEYLNSVGSALVGGTNAQFELVGEDDLRDLLELREYLRSQGKVPPEVNLPQEQESLYFKSERNAARAYIALRKHSTNRRFFTASSGYIGTGPQIMQPGDIICDLVGGLTPFVMRTCDKDEWILVGPCYVHGIMEGEALWKHDEEGTEIQAFHIR